MWIFESGLFVLQAAHIVVMRNCSSSNRESFESILDVYREPNTVLLVKEQILRKILSPTFLHLSFCCSFSIFLSFCEILVSYFTFHVVYSFQSSQVSLSFYILFSTCLIHCLSLSLSFFFPFFLWPFFYFILLFKFDFVYIFKWLLLLYYAFVVVLRIYCRSSVFFVTHVSCDVVIHVSFL